MNITGFAELKFHEAAMRICEKRSNLIANNIANIDTPGYKATDLDFKSMMSKLETGQNISLEKTRSGHISTASFDDPTQVLYREPITQSLDGNTVNGQLEVSEFTNNNMHYSASMQFFTSSMKNIISALKGE